MVSLDGIIEELGKQVEGVVDKLEISTLYVNCSVKSASNRSYKYLSSLSIFLLFNLTIFSYL